MADLNSIHSLSKDACDKAFRVMQLVGLMEELSGNTGPSWPSALAHLTWEVADSVLATQQAIEALLALHDGGANAG